MLTRGEHDAARPPGGHPQPEQQRDGQSRRDRDQPGRAPRCAGRVGQREDGAGAGGADGRNEGRGNRHPERDGRHQADRGHGERRRTGAAEEAGTGIGEQWRGQPSDRQPGRRREQGHDDVLGEEHGSDEARCAADRFEQSDASDLVGHAASDEDGDAGHGEQAEQPAAGQQSSPLVLDQVGALVADLLPGRRNGGSASDSSGRRWVAGRIVLVDERRGCGRIGQLQVQDVGERFSLRGEAAGVRLGEPDQAGVPEQRPPRQNTSGYGAEAAVTATPTTRNDRLFGDFNGLPASA